MQKLLTEEQRNTYQLQPETEGLVLPGMEETAASDAEEKKTAAADQPEDLVEETKDIEDGIGSSSADGNSFAENKGENFGEIP